ncbi:MAG: pilus assembly protein TadG-related protein [Candidatus Sulfotelmatobacter sp.]
MKPPAIRRFRYACPSRRRECGVTMVLVALAMVAIIAIAALSIDVITLYLAREEAQRSADAAALAAVRVLSLSGATGDPDNTTGNWPSACTVATQVAQTVANQNAVGSAAATTVNVNFVYNGTAVANCTFAAGNAFGVNPQVQVQVIRAGLPTFFSRVWSRNPNSVSATATAEAFNSSGSGTFAPNGIVPVNPRCVKPWIVPNRDPKNPGSTCDQGGGPCSKFVNLADGSIVKPGISLNGTNTSGVIGERFWLAPDCVHTGSSCSLRANPPVGNYYAAGHQAWLEPPPSLQYLPGEAPVSVPVAVPSCASSGSVYEEAIAGCDHSTVYQCGVQSSNSVDLSENPGAGTNDTMNGVACLIHEGDATDTQPDGQDTLGPYSSPSAYGSPSSYPFQILAGSSSSLSGLAGSPGKPISSSNSIVSLPIYDDTAVTSINGTGTTNITIVGFLQVFINSVDRWGIMDVTVLNVIGCGNGSTPPNAAVTGSSPVPIRLITPP